MIRNKGEANTSGRLDALADVCTAASESRKSTIKQEEGSNTPPDEPQGTESKEPVVIPTSQLDWESRKQVIQDLYLSQNLPLAEVVRKMHSQHRFKAT